MDFEQLAEEIVSPVLEIVENSDFEGCQRWTKAIAERLRKEFG